MMVGKTVLIQEIARELNIDKKLVLSVINAYNDMVLELLLDGERVKVADLFVCTPYTRGSRTIPTGYTPGHQGRQIVEVPAKKSIKIKRSQKLKDALK